MTEHWARYPRALSPFAQETQASVSSAKAVLGVMAELLMPVVSDSTDILYTVGRTFAFAVKAFSNGKTRISIGLIEVMSEK